MSNRLLKLLIWTMFVCCLSLGGSAQITIGPPKNDDSSSDASRYPSNIRVDFEMTSQEAARLFGAVDDVLAFDSKATGLPARGSVKKELASRDQVQQMTTKRLRDDQVIEHLQRSSLVLKKFRFLPPDFDLGKSLAKGTVDQLAGYYDPRVKTMYLLNWLPAKAQLPVMAHELDHALQDQNFGLQNWMKIQDAPDDNLPHAELEEQRVVRRAVTEGHASAVMLDYVLAPYGKSLAQMPAIPISLIEKTAEQHSQSFAAQNAPLILREEALFPYIYGLEFIHQLEVKAGKQKAFSGVFTDPPRSTRQIMEPDTYISGERLPRWQLPDVGAMLGSSYQKLDDGIMGEFDTMVFLKQFGTPTQEKQITPQWRGGYFYTARRVQPSATVASSPQTPTNLGDIGLLYLSQWATPSAAHAFADVYRALIPHQYPGAQALISDSWQGGQGESDQWNTTEGLVWLAIKGDQVLVLESFDEITASNLMSRLLGHP